MPIKGLGNPYSTVTSSAISNAMRTSGTQGKSLATNKNKALSVVARSEARVTLKDASLFSDLIRVSQTPLTQVKQLNVGLKGMADTISKLSSVVKTAGNANPDQVKLLEQQGKDLIEIYNTKLGNIKFSDKNLIKDQELALNLRVSSGVDDVFEVRVEEFRNIDGAVDLKDNKVKGDEMLFGFLSNASAHRIATKTVLDNFQGAVVTEAVAKTNIDNLYGNYVKDLEVLGFNGRESKKLALQITVSGVRRSGHNAEGNKILDHIKSTYTTGDTDLANYFDIIRPGNLAWGNVGANANSGSRQAALINALGYSNAQAATLEAAAANLPALSAATTADNALAAVSNEFGQKGQARLGVVNGMKMGSPADIKATEAALDAISKQLEAAISRTESAIGGIEEMVKGMTLSQEFAKDTAGQIQNVDVLDASDKVSEASKAITLAAQVKSAGNKAINQVLETAGEELRR